LFFSLKNHLKFNLSQLDCCIKTNDIHHHLIISTPNSLNNSDFTSTTMSTINSYLSAISNHSKDLTEQITLQGPCGNNTYQCLSKLNDYQSMFITHWKDEQLIIGQIYSTINGYFGTVKLIRLLKLIFVIFLIRFIEVIFIFVIHMIFSNQFLLKL